MTTSIPAHDSSSPTATSFVLDTGPLLCLGGSVFLLGEYRRRFEEKSAWVGAVCDEVKNTAEFNSDDWATAARAFRSSSKDWLSKPHRFVAADSGELDEVRAKLDQMAEAKAKRQRRVHVPKPHAGETESIVYARRHTLRFITNDMDALALATQQQIPSVTMVGMAKHLVKDGVNIAKLTSELQSLTRRRIGIGGTVRSYLDLR